jgi:hypothetical protein
MRIQHTHHRRSYRDDPGVEAHLVSGGAGPTLFAIVVDAVSGIPRVVPAVAGG